MFSNIKRWVLQKKKESIDVEIFIKFVVKIV